MFLLWKNNYVFLVKFVRDYEDVVLVGAAIDTYANITITFIEGTRCCRNRRIHFTPKYPLGRRVSAIVYDYFFTLFLTISLTSTRLAIRLFRAFIVSTSSFELWRLQSQQITMFLITYPCEGITLSIPNHVTGLRLRPFCLASLLISSHHMSHFVWSIICPFDMELYAICLRSSKRFDTYSFLFS